MPQLELELYVRLLLASLISIAAGSILGPLLLLLAAPVLGEGIASLLVMALLAILIGLFGHELKIIRFPVLGFVLGKLHDTDPEAEDFLRAGAALPLSFASSFLWSGLVITHAGWNGIGLFSVLCVPIGTLMQCIIYTEEKSSPREILWASVKGMGLMILVYFILEGLS